MRFRVHGELVEKPCFWIENETIVLIDQRMLPHRIEFIKARTLEEQIDVIKTLGVRGAPAIGSFGAYSLAFSIWRGESPVDSYNALLDSRPTAVDLKNCMDDVMKAFTKQGREGAIKTADDIYNGIIDSCHRIGKLGARLIPDGARIMTHCNAGALASIDWGTALSPIRIKSRKGGEPFVWVSETRPLLQGARLTAWELLEEGVKHKVIVDSASGYLMREGEVDLVITGADRVCSNGDLANKVGTYEKAVLARENGIPFYVAFPSTTIDPQCHEGVSIPIEIRDGSEIAIIKGVRIIPDDSSAFNPAFDMTPANLVTAYITEDGIFTLDEFIRTYKKKGPG